MTKLKTYFIISVIVPSQYTKQSTVVKITNYYAEFYILLKYCVQHHFKYRNRLLLRCIHHFKSVINNMGHVCLLALHLLELFIWGHEWKSDRGWSYIERSERSCIRNRSGVGRTERGLVSRKDGGRSGRAVFERGCIRDTARIQRGLIGDRYALQSERVIFYPIIPD